MSDLDDIIERNSASASQGKDKCRPRFPSDVLRHESDALPRIDVKIPPRTLVDAAREVDEKVMQPYLDVLWKIAPMPRPRLELRGPGPNLYDATTSCPVCSCEIPVCARADHTGSAYCDACDILVDGMFKLGRIYDDGLSGGHHYYSFVQHTVRNNTISYVPEPLTLTELLPCRACGEQTAEVVGSSHDGEDGALVNNIECSACGECWTEPASTGPGV